MGRKKVDVSTGFKYCPQCKETKPLSEFYERVDRPGSGTYRSWCKKCTLKYERDHKEERNKYLKLYNQKNREKLRDQVIKRKYGISLKDFQIMVQEQEGKCKICDCKVQPLHIDHDHVTGKVRGLLCGFCNAALGLIREDIKILKNMESYLSGSI